MKGGRCFLVVVRQKEKAECGLASLATVAKWYKKVIPLTELRTRFDYRSNGSSMLEISRQAEQMGFRTMGVHCSIEDLIQKASLPVILHWKNNHFIVLFKINKKRAVIGDPAYGLVSIPISEFLDNWIIKDNESIDKGFCLLLEPTPAFHQLEDIIEDKFPIMEFVLSYIRPYWKYLFYVSLDMLVGTLLVFILPFLTQGIIDIGIGDRNLAFISLAIIGQIFIFLSQSLMTILRQWINLHVSGRVSIALRTDFFAKLNRLPLSFFNADKLADMNMRIKDLGRFENLLTNKLLNFVFSVAQILIFSVVLFQYNPAIFTVFMSGTFFYILWITIFLKKRRDLDYRNFNINIKSNDHFIQSIGGMSDIRQAGKKQQRLWEWGSIQTKVFDVNKRVMILNQIVSNGASLINQLKNVSVTFITAYAAFKGEITLGMMLSVQFIVGQINVPIAQIIGFIHSFQNTKIGMERISEILILKDENNKETLNPVLGDISIRELYFRYNKNNMKTILKEININIPYGKHTAIIGESGGGKSTLIKLLTGEYEEYEGEILIGNTSFKNINKEYWRSCCGVVNQDGFIFAETLLYNITMGESNWDEKRLYLAMDTANLTEIVNELSNGIHTILTTRGTVLSSGQKQRILIARCLYKLPDFIFFDEATSSLDVVNEKEILSKIKLNYPKVTLISVAHRLNSIKDADQIIVISKGSVLEMGNHDYLLNRKGAYYELLHRQEDTD